MCNPRCDVKVTYSFTEIDLVKFQIKFALQIELLFKHDQIDHLERTYVGLTLPYDLWIGKPRITHI